MKRQGRICIAGYAGCGNLGDDAILFGILEGLWRGEIQPEAVTVLSGSPRRSSRRFGVRCVGRKNPFAVLFALLRAKVFVLGGGTLLQNATGNRSLFYYLFLLRLARLCGCRILCLGGLGPLRGAGAVRRTCAALSHCSALLLRDRESLFLARGMGLKNRLFLGADSAFLLPLPPPLRAPFLHRRLAGSLQKPFVCVCPCKGAGFWELSAYLARLAPEIFPVFVVCDEKRDRACAQILRRRFGGKIFVPREASDACALFSAAEITLSCRLHPLILSAHVGAKSLCFPSGDPKLSAFCRRAGILAVPPGGAENAPLPGEIIAPSPRVRRVLCKCAAKDLAILSQMVYNSGSKKVETPKTGEKRNEKRTTGGFAPPGVL